MRVLKTLAVSAVCIGVVVAGAAAEVTLMPRLVPAPARPIKSTPGMEPVTEAQMESILAKVARSLDEPLRVRLAEAILTESGRAGYDPLFVLALVAVESRFRAQVSSERGAAGLMQLMPSTFAWIAGREPDLDGEEAVSEDPVLDVRLAIRYFRWLERRFHTRDDALMAYNAGPRRLLQYKKAGEVPDTLREYPRRVLKEYQQFVRMIGQQPPAVTPPAVAPPVSAMNQAKAPVAGASGLLARAN
jgi:soluble lytic murein transglycosylase-like protein